MTSESGNPDPSPEPKGGAVPSRRTRTRKGSAWLYLLLGAVFSAVGVIGLLSNDSSLVDWLLLALGLINLAIGVRVLRVPDEPFYDRGPDQAAGDER